MQIEGHCTSQTRQNSEKQAQELKKMELEKKDLKASALNLFLTPLLWVLCAGSDGKYPDRI